MTLFKTKNQDLLNGPLIGKIFAFVIPLIITNLLQCLYNAADMIVVGLSDVEGAIGAIGTTSAMINLILNIFAGFAAGSCVVVARRIGEGSREGTRKAVHTALLTGFVFGVICMIIGLTCCRTILMKLGDEGFILDLATLYTKFYFIGVPFMALTNFLISVFRAKGDTSTPLFVLTLTGILNVILNLFFVLVCRMSVDGVALATSISNLVSMLILAFRLTKEESWCRLDLKALKFDGRSFKDIIVNGLPTGLQGALFSISNMIIQSSIISLNTMMCPGGSDVIDGNAAACSLEGFAYTATNSVCQASITFTSQHFGAKKFKRIGLVMRDCYLVTFVVATVVSWLIIGFKVPLLKLYVDAPLAIETGVFRIKVMLTLYFLLAFMEVGSGILRGLDRSLLSTILSLMGSCVLRIIWIGTVFKSNPTFMNVYLSYPLSWGVTAIFSMTCSLLIRRKYLKQQEKN